MSRLKDQAGSLSPAEIVLLIALLASSIAFLRRILRQNSRNTRLPPGPAPDPIIGHLRQIPQTYAWLKFAEWSKAYGDIVYVNVLGKPMIILGSVSAARELMEARGANYSDRPRIVMHGEL
jgi:hypothetical protein